jgi:hypothetical protein
MTTGPGFIVFARVLDSSTKHTYVRPTRQNWRVVILSLIMINFKTTAFFRKFFTSSAFNLAGRGLESICTGLVDFSEEFALSKDLTPTFDARCFNEKI